jgi:hypothetical protein
MNWLYVALTTDVVGLGGLATYWALGSHRRRRVQGRLAPAVRTGRLSLWGPDVECGIAAVDRDGHVVGTVLVPAPSLN